MPHAFLPPFARAWVYMLLWPYVFMYIYIYICVYKIRHTLLSKHLHMYVCISKGIQAGMLSTGSYLLSSFVGLYLWLTMGQRVLYLKQL